MGSNWKIITDEATQLLKIGEVYGSSTNVVTDQWIKEFAIATRDSNPLWYDDEYAGESGPFGYRFAPASFFTALNPTERGEVTPHGVYFRKLNEIHNGKGSGGFAAFSEVEYHDEPIRVGDTITCDLTVRETYEKESKTAILVFIVMDYAMKNQDGKELGVATAAWIQSYPKE